MFYLLEILKLDAALEVLYLNKDQLALSIREIQKKMPFNVPDEQVSMMVDKFMADNLVSKKSSKEAVAYFISYEGMKFYQRGGYLKASVYNFFKRLFKLLLVALGVISTVVGIVLGLRELL